MKGFSRIIPAETGIISFKLVSDCAGLETCSDQKNKKASSVRADEPKLAIEDVETSVGLYLNLVIQIQLRSRDLRVGYVEFPVVKLKPASWVYGATEALSFQDLSPENPRLLKCSS